MNEKIPYYMAYPIVFPFEDGRTEKMDLQYLQSMYPEIPKRILPYVEEECDRMEYENSMIYDQYPDKLQLKLMCRRVCEKIKKYEHLPDSAQSGNIETGRKIMQEPEKGMIRDLVEVMLFQELHRRRCEYRRNRRKFY